MISDDSYIELDKLRSLEKPKYDGIAYIQKTPKLGIGWKLLILGVFIMLLWIIANPHFEPRQFVHITRSSWSRDMPNHDYICTNDTKIMGLAWARMQMVTGGTCAYLDTHNVLVLFKEKEKPCPAAECSHNRDRLFRYIQ